MLADSSSPAKKCYQTGSTSDCADADDFCGSNIEGVYENSGLSYYDVRTSDSIPSTYVKFLNSASTRNTIGATQSYTECSDSAVSSRKRGIMHPILYYSFFQKGWEI